MRRLRTPRGCAQSLGCFHQMEFKIAPLTESIVMEPTSAQPPIPTNSPAPSPQGAAGSCPACARPTPGATNSWIYVYALGRIQPRFPSLGVEKEFAQVTGRSDTSRLTDRE